MSWSVSLVPCKFLLTENVSMDGMDDDGWSAVGASALWAQDCKSAFEWLLPKNKLPGL